MIPGAAPDLVLGVLRDRCLERVAIADRRVDLALSAVSAAAIPGLVACHPAGSAYLAIGRA